MYGEKEKGNGMQLI